MRRIDTFKEFLITIFGSTTVKATGGKIYRSGNLFSTCDYGDKALEEYVNLLKIAYSNRDSKIQRPNYPPEAFHRTESIQRFFAYLKAYNSTLTLPDVNDSYANIFAFKAAITILDAIFSKSDSTNKFKVENEDISGIFRKALDYIKANSVARDIKAVSNAVDVAKSKNYFYDTDYSNDNSQYNYSIHVVEFSVIPKVSRIIYPISLGIYIDPSKRYDDNSQYFFNLTTSSFAPFNKGNAQMVTTDEFLLSKPLSLVGIRYFPLLFDYVTHLDDATILNNYKCANKYVLNQFVIEKAVKQYTDYMAPSIAEYEKSLVDYMEDLIRRVLSLDLKWLYNNSEKKIEKCREEIEIVLIGYPEVYSYIDGCSDKIIRKQLLTILHHAIVEITQFINNNGKDISKYAITHNCENHIKYVKGRVYGKSFKELNELSEKLKETPTEGPHSLYECYYYTSSNELADLLSSISNYKNLFKKSKKSS
ncbi:hypothetical protein [Ruminococcus flavefaciens]|uniref:hypothetical protein n=1 Tax=Ruminococcus flavefaciens TaxID=1265 RepID=UPI00048D3CE5|nr:hypothetical protein [Ruminococcus flavefaciens]